MNGNSKRTRLGATALLVVSAALVAGCAVGPGGSGTSTQYKGDAPWNISLGDDGSLRSAGRPAA